MKKPKPYQADCVKALTNAYRSGRNRALVVMASGLGKTLTSAFSIREFFAERGEDSRVLFLCHNNEILNKAKTEYMSVFGEEYSYGLYTGVEKTSHRVNFLFASFQTMKLHLKEFDTQEFYYIVVDEAHHGQASTFKKVITYFMPQFLLGMTATPKRLDGLNISEIFGDVIYEKDLPQAIKEHLLATVDYRLLLDDIEDIFKYLGRDDITIAELNRNIFVPKRDDEIVRIINEKVAEREHPKTIVFCPSISHANIIAELIDGAVVVHSELPQSTCYKRIAAFRGGKVHTIVSVDQLNEGVDIPGADVIVFLRSTVSPTIFYQQLGRGLRKTQGKKSVLVLDFVANCERIEMIENLRRATTSASNTDEKDDSGRSGSFNLDIATQQFRESQMDIMSLIANARANDRQFYSKEFIIHQIQSLAKDLGRTPTVADFEKSKSCHMDPSIIKRYFGSYNGGLIAAGLQPNHVIYQTDEELLRGLRGLYERLARVPLAKDLSIFSDMPCVSTYRKRFGTFANALYLAGITREKPKQKLRCDYTSEQLIEFLQDLGSKLGRAPHMSDLEGIPGAPARSAYFKHFGTWSNAQNAAGFTPSKPDYARSELIDILKSISEKKGGAAPSRSDLKNATHAPSINAFIKEFGSWTNALRAAGFVPPTRYSNSYTDDELIEILQNKAKSLGRVPGIRDMNADSNVPSAPTYEQHFGSYGNAVKIAGLKLSRNRNYTEGELILQLQILAKKIGRSPTTREVGADPDTAAPVTFTQHFGSWDCALHAAGLERRKKR